jgi:hypothetical protein
METRSKNIPCPASIANGADATSPVSRCAYLKDSQIFDLRPLLHFQILTGTPHPPSCNDRTCANRSMSGADRSVSAS